MVNTNDPEVPLNSQPDQTAVPDESQAADPIEVTPEAPAKTDDLEELQVQAKAEPKKAAPKKTAAKPKAEVHTEPKKAVTPKKTEEDYKAVAPSYSTTVRLQRALGRHHAYFGPANGRFDEKTQAAVQKFLKTQSLAGYSEGNLSEKDAVKLEKFAKAEGGYSGTANGKLDENSWINFVLGLERTK